MELVFLQNYEFTSSSYGSNQVANISISGYSANDYILVFVSTIQSGTAIMDVATDPNYSTNYIAMDGTGGWSRMSFCRFSKVNTDSAINVAVTYNRSGSAGSCLLRLYKLVLS